MTILSACSSKAKKEINHANTFNITEKKTIENNTFQKQPAKTIIDFLKWYRLRQDTITNNLVNNNDGTEQENYSVNFEETEKYLSNLKSTNFISDKYLNIWRNYFKKCDVNFQNHPQKDQAPVGFEYDFIMLSQDYEDDLNDCEKSTIISQELKKDRAIIKVNFPHGNCLSYNLSKLNDKWLIDDIYRE